MSECDSGKADFFDCYADDYIADKIDNRVCDYIDYREENEHFRLADFIKGEFDRDIDEFTDDSLDELEKWCLEIADCCLDVGMFDK